MSTATASDAQPVGQTPHLASRIQSLASVDTVLLSASTAKLVEGHFELRALGPQTPKGFTKPVELFRVVRATGARSKFEAAARRALTPFVGRDEICLVP